MYMTIRKHNKSLRCAGLLMAGLAMLAGCGNSGKDGKQARQDYERSLGDSVTVLQSRIDSCSNAIATLRDNQGVWLRDFETVSNPREAAPYLIYRGFRNRYPPTGTGLIARLAENGQFELVASISGTRFTSIAVTSGSATATSEIIPADQALNYMAGNLNTVLFTGPKADSIGHLIADNELNPLTVSFINGRAVGSWKIPDSYAKMITASYELYHTQTEINRLERRIPMLNQKLSIIRNHMQAVADSVKKY